MVAIKDFKMPKTCGECLIIHDGQGCPILNEYVKYSDLDKKLDNCPLVEIKEIEDGKELL